MNIRNIAKEEGRVACLRVSKKEQWECCLDRKELLGQFCCTTKCPPALQWPAALCLKATSERKREKK